MPTALDIRAKQNIAASTSFPNEAIRSANSSITITINGMIGSLLSVILALYEKISLEPLLDNASYLLSISVTAHFKAPKTFLLSVMTGVIKWGISLYKVSSTLFGSTNINFKTSGEC